MNHKLQKFLFFLCFPLLLTLTNCGVKNPLALPVSTTSISLTPLANSPTDTGVSPTQVFSTWTPVPTLPADLATKRILELFENNGDCELPCWWGIVPGKTTWAEASQILGALGYLQLFIPEENPTGQMIQVYIFQTYGHYVPKEIDKDGIVGASFIVQDGIVKAIKVNISHIERGFDYSLSGILTKLGRPEVWIRTQPHTFGPSFYYVFLFYPTKGYIWLQGDEEFEGDMINICPQYPTDPYPPVIALWSKQDRITFQEGYTGIQWYFFQPYELSTLNRLDDISSNITEQEFYDIYRNPDTIECIEVTHP